VFIRWTRTRRFEPIGSRACQLNLLTLLPSPPEDQPLAFRVHAERLA
jgi:hypothetical protein